MRSHRDLGVAFHIDCKQPKGSLQTHTKPALRGKQEKELRTRAGNLATELILNQSSETVENLRVTYLYTKPALSAGTIQGTETADLEEGKKGFRS